MDSRTGQALCGAEIAEVLVGGIADQVGLTAGDRIVAIDGNPVVDILDYHYRTFPEQVQLHVVRPDGQEWEISVEKDEGEPLGIGLAAEIFDQQRACDNHCPFCFVSQLPPGLRPALYFRDDDIRLSVLHGNFVTLSNLTAADWDRLREQRLSPLHVSIHATEDRLRRRMLGNRHAPPLLSQIRELIALGIEVHGQIVLCPGINDGEVLDRTLADLLALPSPLASLAVVPVGVTRWTAPGIRQYTPDEATALLKQMAPWQKRFATAGGGLWAADEWYLKAGVSLPSLSDYGDFPQLANGVGMARDFIHAFRLATRRLPDRLEAPRRVILATGMLFGPLLSDLAARLAGVAGLQLEVAACANDLFGGGVTVAGLLGGRDVIAGLAPLLREGQQPDLIVAPASMLRDAGDLTLDDMSIDELAARLRARVAVAEGPGELVRLILGRPEAGKGVRRR